MKTAELERIIQKFNAQYVSAPRPSCFSGALKKVRSDCRALSDHILTSQGSRGSSGNSSWIVSRIDAWSQKQTGDYDVIIAVGINYGQDSNIPHPIYDDTKMGPNLVKAFNLLQNHLTPGCIHSTPPVRRDFHLVAFNFFPWLTSAPWSELGVNCIEEALLIYCLGYADIFEPLKDLLSLIGTGKDRTTWIVFHGANNAVPMLGAAFCQTLNPSERPDVLFCDNLAYGVANNSVVLCRPSGSSPTVRHAGG